MKKVISLLLLFMIAFTSFAYAAVSTKSLGSNVQAALLHTEETMDTAYINILNASKSDMIDSDGYIRYVYIDIDFDGTNELVVISTNTYNGKDMYFYSFRENQVFFLGTKRFDDASYPFSFFKSEKGFMVIQDTVDGFTKVILENDAVTFSKLIEYKGASEDEMVPLNYDVDLPVITKDSSTLSENLKKVLESSNTGDNIKTKYKDLLEAAYKDQLAKSNNDAEVAKEAVKYYLEDINDDDALELGLVTNINDASARIYYFSYDDSLHFLGSTHFGNSKLERTNKDYLVTLSGQKGDYHSYKVLLEDSTLSFAKTHSDIDNDFNSNSDRILQIYNYDDTTKLDEIEVPEIQEVENTTYTPEPYTGSKTSIIIVIVVILIVGAITTIIHKNKSNS